MATYSVLHGRDGAPGVGGARLRPADGTRCYGRLEDPGDLAVAEQEELVGRTVHLTAAEGGVNLARL